MIFMDLDGTVFGRNLEAFVAECNERFDLQLTAHQTSYRSLMEHPVMLACKANSKDQFEAVLASIEQAPAMLDSLPPLAGAVEGIHKLAQYTSITYCTVRKAHPPFTPADIELATKRSLERHRLPASDQVIFCMSLMNKWLQVYQRIRTTDERHFLVDDLASQLLTAFEQLQAGMHPRFTAQECQQIAKRLREHVTLVAFGSPPLAINSDLQVYHLPAWKDVDDFISCCLQ